MADRRDTRLRLLVWPGMPAPEALGEVGRRLGLELDVEVISSNEDLESRMDLRGPYDLVCPSDYMAGRRGGGGGLARLDLDRLPSLGNLEPWVLGRPHDPEGARSVPLAFGTTGYLYDRSRVGDQDGWDALFDPMEGVPVGMLSEVREVIGAALIATGHSPNETAQAALSQALGLLEAQARSVVRYSSDDFVGPVADGDVAVHHAWNGPSSVAVRAHERLRYVVPREGAVLWITTGAVPVDAPNPVDAHAVLENLLHPEVARPTVERYGYSTPNGAARRLLPPELEEDPVLFPDAGVLGRCEAVRDVGPEGLRRLEELWSGIFPEGNDGP